MTLWFVFALMTAAAIFAVLWPLGRGLRDGLGGSESAVYKDQLAEIGRDAETGLIAPAEAQAARVEISRRLLAAADVESALPAMPNTRSRRAVAVAALVGLPLVAMACYLPLGSPRLADAPLEARVRLPGASEPLDNLVAQVEAHLTKNPTDGRGWSVLAPVLARLGRFDDAVKAYRNSIAYNGERADRRADLGEAIASAASGVITAQAKSEFERAVTLDGTEAKARYFLGVAAAQDGRVEDAVSIWRAMLATAPADAPWRPQVQAALARAGSPALPALSDDAIAAARDMAPSDRAAMVQGMIERLATRLKQDGGDVDGWLRLVRAYMVLGDRDRAKSALADARQAFGGDAERLRQLNEGLKNSGLDG